MDVLFDNKTHKKKWFTLAFLRLVLAVTIFSSLYIFNESSINIVYFSLSIGLYLLIMLLITNLKVLLIVEMLSVLVLFFYFDAIELLLLLLVPSVLYFIEEKKLHDLFVYPVLFSGATYLVFKKPIIEMYILFGIGVFVITLLLYIKNKSIHEELKRNKVLREQDIREKNEMSQELLRKTKDLDITSKMFAQFQVINQRLDKKYLKRTLVEGPLEILNARAAVLYLKDESQDYYYIYEQTGNFNTGSSIPEKLSLDEFGESFFTDEKMRMSIKLKDKEWGILDIYEKRGNMVSERSYVEAFTDIDFERMKIFVQQVMFSIGHTILLEKYKDMANNDFLTKIPNRRNFFKNFDTYVNNMKKGNELACIIMDIDDFKKINDEFGHDVGDEVLIKVANAIEKSVGNMGKIGRLGGEEFGALIQNSNRNIDSIVERIRSNVKMIKFDKEITLSIGVSFYGDGAKTVNELYRKADEALYMVKENGKNGWLKYEDIDAFLEKKQKTEKPNQNNINKVDDAHDIDEFVIDLSLNDLDEDF